MSLISQVARLASTLTVVIWGVSNLGFPAQADSIQGFQNQCFADLRGI